MNKKEELEKEIKERQDQLDYILGKERDWKWLNENRESLFRKHSKESHVREICFSGEKVIAWRGTGREWRVYESSLDFFEARYSGVASTNSDFIHIASIELIDLLRRKTERAETEGHNSPS